MELPAYNLVDADNSTNTKRGSVCVYSHNSLPFKVIDIQFLNETFADNFELTLDSIIKNPFLIVALGDFSAKTNNWYKNDINSYEGLKIDIITSQFGLQQLLNPLI